MPWLFITTGFITILFIPTGLYTSHILVFFIGLVGVGSSLVLFALTANKKWSGYGRRKSISWLIRFIAAALSIPLLYSAKYYYPDVQAYLNQNYETVSGIPSKIIYVEESREFIQTITVNINNEDFDVYPKPKYYNNIEALKTKTFTIHYLPKTKWVVEYRVQ